MPFSSAGETIDFIYGVINWKEIADSATAVRHRPQQASPRSPRRRRPSRPSPVWADGPNAEPLELDRRRRRSRRMGRARSSASTPASPTASAPPATAPRRRAAPTSAAAPPSTARSAIAYDFALAAEADARRLCRAARRCRPQGAGAGADDSGGQARLRHRLRQGAASPNSPPPWPGRAARTLPVGALARAARERAASRPSSRPNAAPAAPSRSRTPAKPPARRCAPPARSAMSTFPARRSSSSSSPAATKSAALAVIAPVADEALLERAIRKAAA